MTPEQRAAVIAEAESWLRTPYHSNAAVKGSGADCALFPLVTYKRALPLPDLPLPTYQQQWSLHGGEELYLAYVFSLGAVEISVSEAQPADFALWRMGRLYSHGGIITGWPRVIHAVNPGGVIREDASVDARLRRTHLTQPRFFTFQG